MAYATPLTGGSSHGSQAGLSKSSSMVNQATTLQSSGVPQGTVLGPLCFLLYINDMGNDTSSHLRLFADDSLLYREVTSAQDALLLQSDLDKLVKWADTWQMAFHPSKCYVMRITRSTTPLIHDYTMLGQKLETVKSYPYLGVNISNSLSWKTHSDTIAAKASKTLGFVKRNLHHCPEKVKAQAYMALVRPTLEYASAA